MTDAVAIGAHAPASDEPSGRAPRGLAVIVMFAALIVLAGVVLLPIVATALGVQVFDPTGRLCGVLPKPQPDKPLTSCGLSGPNREYLFVTNGDKIYRRKVQAMGTVFFKPPHKKKHRSDRCGV